MEEDLDGAEPPRRRWTGPEKWSVALTAVGVLVAVVATVEQLVR
ncbi:hypothetical protein [Streptomyces tremellae]